MSNIIPFRSTVPTQLDELFDGLFQEFWRSPAFIFERNWKPTEVRVTEKEYTIEIELPRFKKEDITIEIVDSSIVITAKNNKTSFIRSFSYSDANFDETQSKLEDGVLTVTVPRQEPKVKKIEIK